jgi:hypothetical protein
MNEFIFLIVLAALVGTAFLIFKRINRQSTGRQKNHPVYHEESTARKAKYQPAGPTLVRSHAAQALNAKEDMWRASRIKANETNWQPGVIAANKILTDSEWALEEQEPELGHGIPTIKYTSTEPERRPRAAGSKGGLRRT